ncbi:MAG: hypothetical protein KME13_22125 [Myxacorys californica WJT36-NPBG1]|nr:hypothetical protein [Myxacorys californica WJT36-NPBG1]
MKLEIDSEQEVCAWLKKNGPAVFQGQDLTTYSDDIAKGDLSDCVFIGCRMTASLAQAAVAASCLVVPPIASASMPFDPFRPLLYTPAELYKNFDYKDPDTYKKCLDWIIYESFLDPKSKAERPVDVDVILLRRLHDASIADALDDFMDLPRRKQSVAIMGGHDVPRDRSVFADIALLAQKLALQGYFVVTGGGPGLMEAGNLGAYTAGFKDPEAALKSVLVKLAMAPTYKDAAWLSVAFEAWQSLGSPDNADKSQNLGIPTWFYGHEPPNVFATHIAKYFENSVREEGLLALALGGIIFAEGNGGTVQEIFQDANQNYYRTYGGVKSPMILLGVDYWNPPDMTRHNPKDKRKKVYPLLEKLASEKAFSDYLLLTDDLESVIPFLRAHPPA